jgi:hypothetical protein
MQEGKIMDGEAAVWAKDAVALENALSAGWTLPYSSLKGGFAQDITLPLRVVASGWDEGWEIWLAHDPGLSQNQIIIEASLSQAQYGIVAEIIRVNAGQLPWDRPDDNLKPPHVMFQLIGSQMGRQVSWESIAQTANVLRQAGFDPQEPYPGDFDEGSWAPPGHTLWSWALLWGYWDLAEGLEVGSEAFDMPHCIQSLDRWFEKAWVPNWVSAAGGGLSMGMDFARETWLSWMNEERFLKWSSRSSVTKNAEMHATLSELPAEYQAVVWEGWLGRNGVWSPLHDITSSLLPLSEIQAVLDRVKKSVPEISWKEGWEGQDEYGMSAQTIWNDKRAQ